MGKANGVHTPIESGARFTRRQKDEEKADQKAYQELIGSVNYAAVATRADISYAVGLLGRFASDPSINHQNGAKRLLRYLQRTAGKELCLGNRSRSGSDIAIYADADFAGDAVAMRSTSGMVVKDRYGATVAWKSTKQPITARSTADAEFIATAMAMEYLWLSDLEKEFHYDRKSRPIPIYNDNTACIANINSGEYQPQSRHVGVRYFWIKDLIRFGEATVSHIASDKMLADGLTKGLDRTKHNLFIEYLGLI